MEDPAYAGGLGAVADDDVRVQYRVDLPDGPTGMGGSAGNRTGVAICVETTGRCTGDLVVELALRRFRFDPAGVITYLDRTHGWREEPGIPLPPEVARRTGLADEEVGGCRIDEPAALRLLRSASLVVAHDAAVARPVVERRLPSVGNLAWACSMTQIDWAGRAFDGRALGYLLRQAGWFHQVHRAPADVDALIQLLRCSLEEDRPALAELIDRAARPSWVVRAIGAPFDVKDLLGLRGYRWDPDLRTWWKEIDDAAQAAEEIWLAANVFPSGAGVRARHADFEEIDSTNRFKRDVRTRRS